MIRVLYIARYFRPSQERKIELLAGQSDLDLWLIRPNFWQDEYGRVELPAPTPRRYRVLAVPMLGRINDPHRALYRTATLALRAARPDIVHTEEEPDSLAALQVALARRLFAPQARLIFHTWQNIDRPKSWYVRWITRTSLDSADAILCANREGIGVLRRMGYTGETAHIPPQGADLQIYRPIQPSRATDTFAVAFVGRFVPEKGVDVLLEAARSLGPSLRLLLVGGGPIQSTLEMKARDLGLGERVKFVAPMPSERLAKFFSEIDALVLPSRATPVWKEQFGRVLVEAMACKVPVVGSDSGAIPEVIGDAGLIFPEGDVKGLIECLSRLMESPALRRELAERGYARARSTYSQERIAEQTAAFYRELMLK